MFQTLSLPNTNPCTGHKTWQVYVCFYAATLNTETNEPNKGLVLLKTLGFEPIHTLPRHLYHKNAKP
jgi:hypothetical protein